MTGLGGKMVVSYDVFAQAPLCYSLYVLPWVTNWDAKRRLHRPFAQ